MRRRTLLALMAAGLPRLRAGGPCCSAGAAAPGVDYARIRQLLAGTKLFLVPFSHTDWAWVNSRAWMIHRHARILADALDILQSEPGFRFYIETWNEQMEAFLARRPDRASEMRAAINAGKFAVCGATANQHPGWMEPESLIRDMVIGRRLFRDFASSANLEVMIKPDVTPGSSQMPQLLAKAGYRYYGINRPDHAMTKQGIPRQFVWKGLDGSEIITAREGGCGFIRAGSLLPDFATNWEQAVVRLYRQEISEHSDARTAGAVWLPVGCDDSRPLRHWQAVEQNGQFDEHLLPLPEFIREWNKREPAPLQFGTPQEFFAELEKNRSGLPVHEGVIDPAMWTIWYGLNGNNGLRLWRSRTDRTLVSAEKLWSCAARAGATAYPEQRFDTLWRDLLRVYSHAQMWLFQADYDSQMNRLKATLAQATDLRDAALREISGRVRLEENRSAVLLFNDLPWDRTEAVEVWAELQHPTATNIKVSDAEGRPLPFQVVDVNWYDRRSGPRTLRELTAVVEARVPALGYTTIYFDSAPGQLEVPPARSGVSSIETESATFSLSAHGIDSIEFKPAGIRFAGPGNVLFNETKDDPSTYHYAPVLRTLPFSGGVVEEVREGPLRTSFLIRGSVGPHRVALGASYYPKAGRLQFQTGIRSEGGSGHFMTTVGLPHEGRMHADVHFGVEERDVTNIVYAGGERMRKNVFWGGHWTDWSGPRGGLTLVATTGEKGFEYLPDRKRLGHFLLMTLPRDTTTWERFVTRAREGTGEHTFDYQFLFHNGDWKSANAERRAAEAMHPIAVVSPNWMRPRPERSLPEQSSFARVAPGNVQLSALYRDGGRKLVRVYESAGAPSRVSLELPFAANTAREVDFNGEPRARNVSVKGNRIEFDIRPWEIVTLEAG